MVMSKIKLVFVFSIILIGFLFVFWGCGGGGGVLPNPTQTLVPSPTPTPGGSFNPSSVTFGAKYIDPQTVSNYPKAINPGAGQNLPEAVDLTSLMPPVGDQGRLGSCVGWATAYAMRTGLAQRNWNWGTTYPAHQASPAFLYGKLLNEMGLSCGCGTDLQLAHDILVKTGCSSVAYSPYTDANCSYNLNGEDAYIFKIDSYMAIDPRDRNAMQTELSNNNIIVFGARLYDDFVYYKGGVYTGSGNYLIEDGQYVGHAMAVVGYDNSKNAYHIINSWGTGWGENGYMWINYKSFEELAFVAFVSDSASKEPPSPNNPTPVPTPPGNQPTGEIINAFQFYDYWSGYYFLYAEWAFDRPLLLVDIVATSPDGLSGMQPYGFWYRKGYVYFYRVDGRPFIEGNYTFRFDVMDLNGKYWQVYGETYIHSINEYYGLLKVRGRNIEMSVPYPYIQARDFKQGILYGMNHKPCVVEKVK